jgi:hypothetical protein
MDSESEEDCEVDYHGAIQPYMFEPRTAGADAVADTNRVDREESDDVILHSNTGRHAKDIDGW